MKTILKLVITALAVVILANILPGVYITSFTSAIIVAFVIALLKVTVKPILIIFTLPVTILTFGLFLLIINTFVIMLADYFVNGFRVDGFIAAFVFSILLSLFQSFLNALIIESKENS